MITTVASAFTIIGFVYGIVRNFKKDIGKKFDKIEGRIDQFEERMFYLATGKTLAQAMLDEKMKEKK